MHPTLIIEQINNNITHYENCLFNDNFHSASTLISVSKARVNDLYKQLEFNYNQQQPTDCNNKFCCKPIEQTMGIEQCEKCEKIK